MYRDYEVRTGRAWRVHCTKAECTGRGGGVGKEILMMIGFSCRFIVALRILMEQHRLQNCSNTSH